MSAATMSTKSTTGNNKMTTPPTHAELTKWLEELRDIDTPATSREQMMSLETKDALVKMGEQVPVVVDFVGGKDKEVSKTAEDFLRMYFTTIARVEPWGSMYALQQGLKPCLEGKKSKPVQREIVLEIVEAFAKQCPDQFASMIETFIQPVVLLMNDVNKGVKTKAKTCMEAMCLTCGNKDLIGSQPGAVVVTKNFIPVILKACESLKFIEECVEELAGCVFVQNVEAPHLAVMTPVLWRGLNHKNEACQRRCCKIVENMCKLIDDPHEGRPLFPEILPLVQKCSQDSSDPECRKTASQAFNTIAKLAAHEAKPTLQIQELIAKHAQKSSSDSLDRSVSYLQHNVDFLNRSKNFELEAWRQIFSPWLSAEEIEAIMNEVAASAHTHDSGKYDFIDDSEDPDLYKGNFSLAFGVLTLLKDTKLHLKKNKFYGLLGPNNCGKSSLMKAIAQEKVEGFPKRTELVTIFVTHDVEERLIEKPSAQWPLGKLNLDLNGVEFCVDTCNNVYKRDPPVTYEEAEAELCEIGFKNKTKGANLNAAADMLNPITTYSGGWKMKMQLCCAKLINADILMMDEPTGHLDAKNQQWMKDWLHSFDGSIIASSTNPDFLDEMCTHIIDFEDRKLRQFKGERGSVLTKFVEANPSKNAYFELSNEIVKFNFPAPGPLEGVKFRSRAILKMNSVSFKYPTHEKNTVQDICLSVCMASRIAVVGPNGAGKSTAIKLLIGERKPDTGTIFRHSGMRLAYVPQHALEYLEAHMDKTPVQYILWRFAGNDDRQSLDNQTKELSTSEEDLRAVPWCVDSKSGVIRRCIVGEKSDVPVQPDSILNRRKNRQKKYEYEVKWMFKPVDASAWVERDTMIEMGYEKMVCREDEKQAAAAGLMSRPLTAPKVEEALMDFGLTAEEASHTPINSLSDGQKVKVVLTAAVWQNPHILILDEPTNYLDRDGLGALALGLKDFLGGVVIISHDFVFADSVCSQKWRMDAGFLTEEGELVLEDGEAALATGPGKSDGQDEVVLDDQGNPIERNPVKTMNDKEKKKAIKEIEKKLKEHKKKNHLSDAEKWDLEDKLAEYKMELGQGD